MAQLGIEQPDAEWVLKQELPGRTHWITLEKKN